MATKTTTTTKATKATATYNASALGTGTTAMRKANGQGAYNGPLAAMRTAVRGNGAAVYAVQAITHYGWHAPTTQPAATMGAGATRRTVAQVGPTNLFVAGTTAANALAAAFTALHAAVPAAQHANVAALWAVYVPPTTK